MKVLHVVSSWPSDKDPSIKPFIVSQIESLRSAGITVDVLNLHATKNSFNYISGMYRIAQRVRSRRYDVIHAHYGYCGWSAIPQRNVPVVVSIMGNDLNGVLNDRGGQTAVGYFNVLSSRLLVNYADAVIVKSNRMKELINAPHVFVVPNGVDLTMFAPRNVKGTIDQHRGQPKRVIFLGRPESREKNLPLAKEAISIIRRDMLNFDFVNVYGIAQTEIPGIMNSANALLLTSVQEGSPNVIKEAMACNLPIVATDVGDVREMIGDTEGCYVTSFDPFDIAEKLKMCLSYNRRTEGRKHIAHLGINEIAKKVISVYEHASSCRSTSKRAK